MSKQEIDNFFHQFGTPSIIKCNEFEEDHTFIYAIFDINEELLYIGQTVDTQNRFSTHQKKIKNAHFFSFIKVPKHRANDIEASLIIKYLPPENNSIPSNDSYFTIQDYQSLDQRFFSNKVKVLRMIQKLGISNLNGYFLKEDLQVVSIALRKEFSYDNY